MSINSFFIIDLHSDLLSYLAHHGDRSINDTASRSSYPQLISGGVKLQTLAIAAITSPLSVEIGEKQLSCYRTLLDRFPQHFASFKKGIDFAASLVHTLPAFENASAFAQEEEPLDESLSRLQKAIDAIGPIFYITLTWNGDNRFGGGIGSEHGLKEDGKHLLDWLHGKRIAVDISHASDKLAAELINYIDKRSLNIPLIASHSNYRAVTSSPRNLPIELINEIVRRDGLIGLNLFAPFISKDDPHVLIKHVEYALEIGAEGALCFGADFFCHEDFPHIKAKYNNATLFFKEIENASAFPYVVELIASSLSLPQTTLQNICNGNARRFIEAHILL